MDNENQNENMDAPQGDVTQPQASPEAERNFTPEPAPVETMPEPESSSAGPIVGIIVIVILIVLAGFYFWGSSLQTNGLSEEQASEEVVEVDITKDTAPAVEEEATTSVGDPLSGSDEIADLEADLETTDLGGLDAELADIDAELTF